MNEGITIPKNLVWLDLEMTGLNPVKDRIIEVAIILTKFDFIAINEYEKGVKQDENELRRLLQENDFWRSRPNETKKIIAHSLNGIDERIVENEIIAIINSNFGDEPVYLAGNSIHMDRQFIKSWWPTLDSRLHYRMLDVSSFKLLWLSQGKEPFNKSEQHRALADIKESISELKYYIN